MSSTKDYHRQWEYDHKDHRKQYKKKWRKENQNKDLANIICPYFVSETVMQISCESVSINVKCDIHRFKSKELKDNHRSCFCECFNYKKCPYAWQLDKLYNKADTLRKNRR